MVEKYVLAKALKSMTVKLDPVRAGPHGDRGVSACPPDNGHVCLVGNKLRISSVVMLMDVMRVRYARSVKVSGVHGELGVLA